MIWRIPYWPNIAIEKIKRSNYAAFSVIGFSAIKNTKCAEGKTHRKNMPNPG
jgi:hypothetical protein